MIRKPSAALLILPCIAVALAANDKPAMVVTSEFIYDRAPFPTAHASSIAETPQGLIAAWFGGTAEKNPDVGIWVSRRVDGRWQPPVEVANGVQGVAADGAVDRYPTWNPVLFQLKSGPLALFYKVGPTPQSWWGMLVTSGDGGVTWSPPRRLPGQMLGPIKNKAVQLPNGEVLCPSSSEDPRWSVHFERFANVDGPWTRTEPLNGPEVNLIQPTILMLGGDNLLALTRSKQKRIYAGRSPDLGKTWSKFAEIELPHPGSGIDAVTLADGRHLLVYNHTTSGRTPLNLAMSEDGNKWQAALVLENEPGEYSYPAIIQSKDGLVHITYTWRREKVKHVVVDPKQLQGRDMVGGEWPPDVQGPANLTEPPRSQRRAAANPRRGVSPLTPIDDAPGLPRVLLIGDSISIGYTLPVRTELFGKANVHRPPTNCSATIHGLRDLDRWLGKKRWDVIHFNWGLHDLKYIDERWQRVDVDKGRQATLLVDYEANLRALVRRLRKTGAHLIWCTTTPVPTGSHGRIPADVPKYNAVAEKVMKQANVEIDDLYTFAHSRLGEIQLPRDVHFHKQGSSILGKEVASHIKRALDQPPSKKLNGSRSTVGNSPTSADRK